MDEKLKERVERYIWEKEGPFDIKDLQKIPDVTKAYELRYGHAVREYPSQKNSYAQKKEKEKNASSDLADLLDSILQKRKRELLIFEGVKGVGTSRMNKETIDYLFTNNWIEESIVILDLYEYTQGENNRTALTHFSMKQRGEGSASSHTSISASPWTSAYVNNGAIYLDNRKNVTVHEKGDMTLNFHFSGPIWRLPYNKEAEIEWENNRCYGG